ncbi:MAG TPA: MFS transporter [Spirochaetales bacterium]|nr:MFS transporter [Spirochaetales bacterium]
MNNDQQQNISTPSQTILKHNKFWLTVEGAASSVYLILTQGALFTAIAIYFKLTTFWLSVTTAFPLVFQVFQLIAPTIIKRSKNRVRLMIIFNAGRFIWFIPLATSLFGFSSALEFIVIFAVSQLANALAGNVWVGLSRDLIPEHERGKFLGRRNVAISITTMISTYIYTAILDILSKPLSIIITILIGMIATIISIIATFPIRDISLQEISQQSTGNLAPGTNKQKTDSIKSNLVYLFSYNKQLLQDSNIKRFVIAMFAWNFILQLTAPFFAYHQITNLSMSMRLIGITSILTSLLSIIFYRIWGVLGDKLGHKSVLVTGINIVSLIPMLWFFMGKPLWPYMMGVDVLLTGLGWSAIDLGILTFGMEIGGKNSSACFALANAGAGISGLAGAVVGGFLGQKLKPINLTLWSFEINGLQFLFLVGGLLRFLGLALFKKVQAANYAKPGVMVTNVLSIIARRFAIRPAELDE